MGHKPKLDREFQYRLGERKCSAYKSPQYKLMIIEDTRNGMQILSWKFVSTVHAKLNTKIQTVEKEGSSCEIIIKNKNSKINVIFSKLSSL